MKLLKTTTDGTASKKSNEIHLKLDNCQLDRIFVDTSGLHATWPDFWAIGLSFLGLNFLFCVFNYLASSPTAPPLYHVFAHIFANTRTSALKNLNFPNYKFGKGHYTWVRCAFGNVYVQAQTIKSDGWQFKNFNGDGQGLADFPAAVFF